MKRKTDNSPVTDESLARVRDEIAEAYSHPSHETVTLDTESYRERMIALTAQRDAMREALRACITSNGAFCYQTGSVHALDCRIKGINAEARAALSLSDGAE